MEHMVRPTVDCYHEYINNVIFSRIIDDSNMQIIDMTIDLKMMRWPNKKKRTNRLEHGRLERTETVI